MALIDLIRSADRFSLLPTWVALLGSAADRNKQGIPMRVAIKLGVLSLGLVGSAAIATPSAPVTYGSGKLPSWTSAAIFETFDTGYSPGNPARTGTLNTGGTFTERSAASLGTAKLNPDDAVVSNVLTLPSGGTYTVDFSQPQQFISFEYGYVTNIGGITLAFSTATGMYNLYFGGAESGRINLDLGGLSGINEFTVGAVGGGAVRIDNIAAAAPEPTTWGMMILGFGAIGVMLRRRRRQHARASFA